MACHEESTEAERRRMTNGGAEGIQTPDPLIANQMLYQLSYSPIRVRVMMRMIPDSFEQWSRSVDFAALERLLAGKELMRKTRRVCLMHSGGAGENCTRAWGFCRPLPYYLATAPMSRRSSEAKPDGIKRTQPQRGSQAKPGGPDNTWPRSDRKGAISA